MDDKNYVAQKDGKWVVVVNGVQVGSYTSQGEAERAYNTAKGMPNDPQPNNRPPISASPTGNDFDWSNFWKSMTESEQKRFEEMIRQYEKGLFSNMAQALLSGAVQLKGSPANWLDYSEFTSGGNKIFDALWGDKAMPGFGAPTGYSPKATIQDVLDALGIGGSGGTGTPQQPGTDNNTVLDWIWNNAPLQGHNLRDFYAGQGWGVNTPEEQRAIVMDWITKADPQWRGMTPAQVAAKLGYGGTQTQPVQPQPVQPQTPPVQPSNNNQMPGVPARGTVSGGITGPGQIGGPYTSDPSAPPATAQPGATVQPQTMAPLPHQVNPAVWDSMSPTAQMMILNAAEHGNTPSGVWTIDDYLFQLNNARPRGTAPRRTAFDWGAQNTLF